MNSPLTSEQITSLNSDGSRRHLLVAEVSGFWRTQRTRVQLILLMIFLITPWTTWNGRQTVLIDIIDREFSFFGFFLRAHNTPLLFFLIGGGALALAGITSVWGRIWCGWGCPQTVFIDVLFRRIEKLIEGTYLQRRALDQADLSFKKIFKKTLKWISFVAASSLIAHSFLAYFVGAHHFWEIIQQGPQAHLTIFYFTVFFSLLFLFDFGWFREQFCTIMCPYGRIQGLLLDKNSLAVEFDQNRKADCVQCHRCVNVCPIGIDIRNGLQMECIACTACIDACDEIMEKVKKPKKLIQYTTLSHNQIDYLKPRTLLYAFGVSVCMFGLIWNLSHLKPAEIFILRGLDTPFKVVTNELGEKKLLNHFRIQISNQSFKSEKFNISTESPLTKIITSTHEISLEPKEFKEIHFFVEGPLTQDYFDKSVSVLVKSTDDQLPFSQNFPLKMIGPKGQDSL